MVSGAVAVPLVVPRQQFIEPGLPKGVIDTNTGKEFMNFLILLGTVSQFLNKWWK